MYLTRRVVLLGIAALGLLAAAGACGSGDSSTTSGAAADGTGKVTAELLLVDGKLTLLGIRSVNENIPPTPEPAADEASLAWEFVGDDGAPLASGFITEPRQAETDFDETGSADPWVGVAPAVIVRLVIPSGGGMIRLLKTSTTTQPLEPQGAGDGEEIDAVPIPGSGGGAESSGCNGGTDPQTNGGGAQDVGGVDGLVKIVDNGSCEGNVNILIMSEGYTQAEMGKFLSAAQGMASSMLNITGFKEYKKRFNVWALQIPSVDSGITDPKTNTKKNTAFNTAFGNDNPTPRRCVIPQGGISSQVQAKRTAAEHASKANITAMLINISEHAGCAIPSERLVTVASNSLAPSVFAHELGHSLYKLKDEYTLGTCNMSRAGGGPNTTKNSSNPPWKSIVNTVFEGAEYCTTGVYRPESDCLMRNLNTPFCKVCANEAKQFFAGRESCETAAPPSCFQGGTECGSDKVCSWNGSADGYCCKQPFKGTETCTTDEECGAGKICGFGGPPDNFFWCVAKDNPACAQ